MNQRLYKINQIAHITCVAYLILETIAKHEDIQKIVIYVNFSTVVAIFFFYIYKENRELEKKKKKLVRYLSSRR